MIESVMLYPPTLVELRYDTMGSVMIRLEVWGKVMHDLLPQIDLEKGDMTPVEVGYHYHRYTLDEIP